MLTQRFSLRHTFQLIIPALLAGHLSYSQAYEDDGFSRLNELSAQVSGQRLEAHHVLSTDTGKTLQKIHLPNAEFIKIHFDEIQLEPGDRIRLLSKSGEKQIITYQDTQQEQDLWALSLQGDTVTVEIRQKKRNAALGLSASLSIDSIQRGISQWDHAQFDEPVLESICGNSDLQPLSCNNADSSITTAAQAVARLSFPCEADGSGGLCTCTAWRVGSRGDTMMTNNHCISSAAQLSGSEVFFNFQTNQCGGGNAYQNQVGVRVNEILMTNHELDVTLFTVRNPGRIAQFGSLSLETQRIQANHEIFIPQHPAGRAKEIAMFSDMDGGNCRIRQVGVSGRGRNTDLTYHCDTEGGSSGSPVISRQTGRVVGLHHFGGCENAGVRMDRIASMVQPYLGGGGSNPPANPVNPVAPPSQPIPRPTNPVPTNPATTSGGDIGIQYVNDTTGILYHKDSGQSAAFSFLCINSDCRAATRQNGRFERTVTITPGATVELEFKVENNGQQCLTGAIATPYSQQGAQAASPCA